MPTPAKRQLMSGPPSLFRGKVRAPISFTMTAALHNQLNGATRRLQISRADVLCLLVFKFADGLTLKDVDAADGEVFVMKHPRPERIATTDR